MKKIILNLMNLLPILTLSCDEYFGSIGPLYKYRISLIKLSLAPWKIYIITFREKKFEFIKILNLNILRPWPQTEEILSKIKNYENSIKNLKKNNINEQILYLDKKTNHDLIAKSWLQNKITNYGAISLVLIGFLLYFLQEILRLWTYDRYSYILLAILIITSICFINLSYYIYSFLKNRSVIRSSFSDLKTQNNVIGLAKNSYCDWYSIKEEKEILSNYVVNAEKYLVKSIFFLSILACLFIIPNSIDNKKKDYTYQIKELSLFNEKGNIDKKNLHLFASLLLTKINDKKNNLYLIKNFKENNKPYNQIINTLDLFLGENNYKILKIHLEKANRKFLIIKVNP